MKRWATIQNLKIAAASYSEADSLSALEQQLSSKSTVSKTARNSLVEVEHQLKDLGQIIKYAEQYQINRIYHIRYQKSKDKDTYLRHHETELLLYGGAENMLKQFGINPKSLDIDTLRSKYNALYAKKETLQQTYKSAEKDMVAIRQKLNNLNQYLEREPIAQQSIEPKSSRDNTAL